jgi:Domain of unknown function (DUF4956)
VKAVLEARAGIEVVLASLLLAFALSLVIAWAYQVSYRGLAFQRSFAQTLALGGVVSAVAMLAIGDDIARGLGLVGALTLIRFRTTLKDTRDLVFAFASLAVGVACGVAAFGVAILGTAIFVAAGLAVAWSGFGRRQTFDAVLRLRAIPSRLEDRALHPVLGRHCRRWTLVNLRELDSDEQEQSYQVDLAHRAAGTGLLRDLGMLPGVTGTSLLMQDSLIEV